jgi:hypothetical protein
MALKQQTKTQDHRTQSQRFIDKARELGCDEDEAAFKEKLKVIARQKPKTVPPPAKSPKPPTR